MPLILPAKIAPGEFEQGPNNRLQGDLVRARLTMLSSIYTGVLVKKAPKPKKQTTLGLREQEKLPAALRPYPLKYVAPWTMKNGNPVTIRPIRPEDEPLMVKFHETLSDRTVYLRYFGALSLKRRVAHERLLRICFCDYDSEMALVAELADPGTGERSILAVGRMSKLLNGNEAEVAVLVSDQYQKLGLGHELLRRVIQIARDEKLSRVSGEMLTDNVAMQVIMQRLGFGVRPGEDITSVRAFLDL